MKTIKPITGLIFPKAGLSFEEWHIADISAMFISATQKNFAHFAWILHRPEEREKKAHIHFLLYPTKEKVDVSFLYDVNVNTNTHTMPVRLISADKVGDWVAYVLHDKDYLSAKGLERKWQYQFSELRGNYESAYLCEEMLKAQEQLQGYAQLFEVVRTSPNFGSLLKSGKVNPSNLHLIREMYNETHS